MLCDDFTEPPGVDINVVECHLVDMFTSSTHSDVKEVILRSFQWCSATLRVVIATIALDLG
jgi:hypothetical protein